MDPDRSARSSYEVGLAEGGKPPRTIGEKLLCRAEEWIYDLNARDHWIFRVYQLVNEAWARVAFGEIRRAAAAHDVMVTGKDGGQVRLRALGPGDEEVFAGLLARFDFEHLPPHPLDRASARRVLRSPNHLPFGLFEDGELRGYLLVRLFFPRRVATGIWSLRALHGRGFTYGTMRTTAELTRRAGLADFVTVPIGHVTSLRAAEAGGWQVIRTNRRFHVLLHHHRPPESPDQTLPVRTSTGTS